MGGSTSTTDKSSNSNTFSSGSSSSTTNPWAAAQPLLGGILGKLGGALDTTALTPAESAALSALEANARAGNPWAPQIGGVAATLLAGGGPDRSDRVQTLDQARLANQQAGIGAADAAFAAQSYGPAQLLAAEAQRRGIPMSALAQLVQMGVPIAGLGQSTASNSVGSSAGSGTSGNQEHAVQSVVARAAGIRAVHGRRQPGRGRRERARNRPLRHAARVECALFHEVNPWLESFPISSAAIAAAACSGR